MSFAATLPLAFVMIAGPQIISAFFFATSEKWKADSGAYVLGAAISVTAIVTAAYVLGAVLGGGSGGGSPSRTLDYVVVALLLFAMAYVILRRKKYTETPKWMARLQTATPKLSLTLGLLLLGLFPSDLATSVSVGMHLGNHGEAWWHTLPFVLLTLLLLAAPALAVLPLGERARTLLPKIRDWMNNNSWIVSEVVLAFFIVIVLAS